MTRFTLSGFVVLVMSGVCIAATSTPGLFPPGRYEITTETSMAHLEENLRRSNTRETRCLLDQDFSTAFPALAHPSLKGCRLHPGQRNQNEISYNLVCDTQPGATGDATWRRAGNRFIGMLHVKLGGKNMTFYQRVTANLLNEC